MRLTANRCIRRSSSTTTGSRATTAAWSTRRTAQRASTRCAAITSGSRSRWTTGSSSRSPSRAKLRDLQGVGVDDDRQRQGQANRAGRAADPGIPRHGHGQAERDRAANHLGRLVVFAGVRICRLASSARFCPGTPCMRRSAVGRARRRKATPTRWACLLSRSRRSVLSPHVYLRS